MRCPLCDDRAATVLRENVNKMLVLIRLAVRYDGETSTAVVSKKFDEILRRIDFMERRLG